jgi:hypothetical protein
MENISENLVLGFDMNELDVPVLTIARNTEQGLKVINIITGIDARILYERLTNKGLGPEKTYPGVTVKTIGDDGKIVAVKLPGFGEPVGLGQIFGCPDPIPELETPGNILPWYVKSTWDSETKTNEKENEK